MDLANAINSLSVELIEKYSADDNETSKTNEDEAKKMTLIKKIEETIWKVIENIARGEFPVYRSVCHTNWKNSCFDDRLSMRKTQIKELKIKFKGCRGRPKFVMITFLLSKIHKLLTTGKTCTRRELYYKNLNVFNAQRQVDEFMKDVCYILESPPWELGVLATSKGLVFGPLLIHFKNGDTVDCSIKGGVSVPSKVSDIVDLSSSAEWVLIVEKDATFHRLLESEAGSRLGSCIIITGKGYPDVSTRMLVCKFWKRLKIPILALNDADPHGFEIMCVYRFGSVSMSANSFDLACPAIRWLGIHPTDIKPLLLDSKSLTERDIRRINSIMKRSYVKENDQFKIQLEALLKGNIKAELEALSNISNNFLVDVYLKSKIRCNEYY